MTDAFTASDAWAQAFTKRAMERLPDLDLSAAIEVCVEAFEMASELDPFEAADSYADACQAGGLAL